MLISFGSTLGGEGVLLNWRMCPVAGLPLLERGGGGPGIEHDNCSVFLT